MPILATSGFWNVVIADLSIEAPPVQDSTPYGAEFAIDGCMLPIIEPVSW
jgi:hypothetical protein